jgi:hypothetical protein
MVLDYNLIKDILIPSIAICSSIILTVWYKDRFNLLVYYHHVSAFLANNTGTNINIHTHSIILKNNGNKICKNIRLGHKILPNVSIFPDTDFKIIRNPGGTSEILIPSLIPKEQLYISYLYFPPVTYDQINTYVKSDEGFAKVVNVELMKVYPKFLNYLNILFLSIGILFSINVLIILFKKVFMG